MGPKEKKDLGSGPTRIGKERAEKAKDKEPVLTQGTALSQRDKESLDPQGIVAKANLIANPVPKEGKNAHDAGTPGIDADGGKKGVKEIEKRGPPQFPGARRKSVGLGRKGSHG